MMNEPMTTLREFAFHEAGHVAVAHHFGRPIGKVWLDPAGYNDAGSDIEVRSDSSPEAARENLMIIMAGMAAQCLAEGVHVGWSIAGARDCDLALGYEDHGFDANNFAPVIALLQHPEVWLRVERVAKALLDRHSLTAEVVASLLSQVCTHNEGDYARVCEWP